MRDQIEINPTTLENLTPGQIADKFTEIDECLSSLNYSNLPEASPILAGAFYKVFMPCLSYIKLELSKGTLNRDIAMPILFNIFQDSCFLPEMIEISEDLNFPASDDSHYLLLFHLLCNLGLIDQKEKSSLLNEIALSISEILDYLRGTNSLIGENNAITELIESVQSSRRLLIDTFSDTVISYSLNKFKIDIDFTTIFQKLIKGRLLRLRLGVPHISEKRFDTNSTVVTYRDFIYAYELVLRKFGDINKLIQIAENLIYQHGEASFIPHKESPFEGLDLFNLRDKLIGYFELETYEIVPFVRGLIFLSEYIFRYFAEDLDRVISSEDYPDLIEEEFPEIIQELTPALEPVFDNGIADPEEAFISKDELVDFIFATISAFFDQVEDPSDENIYRELLKRRTYFCDLLSTIIDVTNDYQRSFTGISEPDAFEDYFIKRKFKRVIDRSAASKMKLERELFKDIDLTIVMKIYSHLRQRLLELSAEEIEEQFNSRKSRIWASKMLTEIKDLIKINPSDFFRHLEAAQELIFISFPGSYISTLCLEIYSLNFGTKDSPEH